MAIDARYERGSRGYGSIIALIQAVIKTMYSIDYCYLFLPMYVYTYLLVYVPYCALFREVVPKL